MNKFGGRMAAKSQEDGRYNTNKRELSLYTYSNTILTKKLWI